jgi:hypothetical protein
MVRKMQASQSQAEHKRSRSETLIFLLILLAAIIIGVLLGGSGLIQDVFGGSGGGGGASRGNFTNQKAVSAKVSTGLGNIPQGVKAGDIKIGILRNGVYGFVTLGANNLLPGDKINRGFTVKNDGTVPIKSITLKATITGAPVMLQNVDVSIDRCASSGICTPVLNRVPLTHLGPTSDVIFSGNMQHGKTVQYVVHTWLKSGTPSSAEGQLAKISYSLVAVGA